MHFHRLTISFLLVNFALRKDQILRVIFCYIVKAKTIQVIDNKQVARIPLTKRRFVGLNVFDISRHFLMLNKIRADNIIKKCFIVKGTRIFMMFYVI
ncbi:hypothetical protein A9G10_04980 [Gilliamella sp. wkB308]|nr:hypothetical protein A9G10_04980 [Gilliamella apicola]